MCLGYMQIPILYKGFEHGRFDMHGGPGTNPPWMHVVFLSPTSCLCERGSRAVNSLKEGGPQGSKNCISLLLALAASIMHCCS